MTNKEILARIAHAPYAFRRALRDQAQRHAEAYANGDYYYDEDAEAWIGYDGRHHSSTNTNAQIGAREENEISRKVLELCGTDEVPSFITYSGDPRGFVVKIRSEILTDDEREYWRELDLMRDWGGDFTIIKNNERI